MSIFIVSFVHLLTFEVFQPFIFHLFITSTFKSRKVYIVFYLLSFFLSLQGYFCLTENFATKSLYDPVGQDRYRSVSRLLLKNNQYRNGFCLQMKGE